MHTTVVLSDMHTHEQSLQLYVCLGSGLVFSVLTRTILFAYVVLGLVFLVLSYEILLSVQDEFCNNTF